MGADVEQITAEKVLESLIEAAADLIGDSWGSVSDVEYARGQLELIANSGYLNAAGYGDGSDSDREIVEGLIQRYQSNNIVIANWDRAKPGDLWDLTINGAEHRCVAVADVHGRMWFIAIDDLDYTVSAMSGQIRDGYPVAWS